MGRSARAEISTPTEQSQELVERKETWSGAQNVPAEGLAAPHICRVTLGKSIYLP